MKKVWVCYGTRPEAIKLTSVIREFQRSPDFDVQVLSTGQHLEMVTQVEEIMGLQPQHRLQVMQADQTLTQVTARILEKIQPLLAHERPDLVLVQGDTTTTFVASLAAYYHKIPVGHIEAGLRTTDRYSPFPEEMNRRLTTQLADLHFAPTERARQALLGEGVQKERIFLTGNTGIDALSQILEAFQTGRFSLNGKLSALLEAAKGPLVLITLHRRENFGRVHEEFLQALREAADEFPQTTFVFPVHLNPAIRERARAALEDAENIHLLEPLDYPSLVALMSQSRLIITDSGGIQEESPTLGVPTLVLRKNTERMEAVEEGFAKLVGTDPTLLRQEIRSALSQTTWKDLLINKTNPYGDGTASRKIVDFLRETQGRLW
jgi:UDP-N-acetylglucosamine 2-epimerase (non-hydrolysing)